MEQAETNYRAADFSQFYEDIPKTDFPVLFSDDEFEGLKEQRQPTGRSDHDRWDNRGVFAPPAKTDGLPESTIEQRFQHVARHLVAMWGSEACALYLKRLLIADREGRQGFPADVIEDLMLLDRLNATVCDKKNKTGRLKP